MEEVLNWTKVNNKQFDKSILMKLVSTNNITVCKVEADNQVVFEPHAHENEQISYVITGEVLVKLGDDEKRLKPGDICIIPPHVVHSGHILSCPFHSIDIFTPVRQDYLQQMEK